MKSTEVLETRKCKGVKQTFKVSIDSFDSTDSIELWIHDKNGELLAFVSIADALEYLGYVKK